MKWRWVEIYANDEVVQDKERHYIDIDFDNLVGFKMRHESGKEFELDISKGKPIHFYRNYIVYSNEGNKTFRKVIAGIKDKELYWFKNDGTIVSIT